MVACECEVCKDIRHLRECGVSEDFMNRWIDGGMDSDVNKAILEGTWPTAVERLEAALDNAIKLRKEVVGG
jgi:hypothetical protein